MGAGADKAARLLDLQAGGSQTRQVAAHDQPIRCVRFFEVPASGSPMIVTGSWDHSIKYWDLRTQNAVATVGCQDRVYSLDVRDKLLVVATADRYVDVITLNDPTKFYKAMQSPLKWQTRCVSCFTDASGYAMGSIEGRCGIQYIEEKDQQYGFSRCSVFPSPLLLGTILVHHQANISNKPSSSNFSFKCHRETPPNQRDPINVYSVNAISFHPIHGTFSTAGSDGTWHFWDKDAKHRLKGYPAVGGAITATSFNRTGDIFAYAISYDWSKGFAHNSQNYPIKIMLHAVGPDECKPRQPPRRR